MTWRWMGLLVLAIPLQLPAQQDVDAQFEACAQRGIDEVYNLDFDAAEKDFHRLVDLKPMHPAGPFFSAMVLWWKILIDIDNEQYDDQFHDALDHVIDLCDEMLKQDEDDVTALFFKGGAIGFQGRLETHRSQWLAAANAGRKALPIVQQAAALDPTNYDIQLGMGIYNYYADVIPREYPFVKPLMIFVPAGDRQKGIEQLRLASDHGKYASVEATYFLMQLYYQFEKKYPLALDLARRLHDRFPNNMLFHRYLGRCHVALANWADAAAVFGEVTARVRSGQRGYTPSIEREAVYYLGICQMNNRLYDEALQYFYRCDALCRGLDKEDASGFMVMANLRIGNIYDVQGKRPLAEEQYRKVYEMKEYLGSRRMAEQYIKTPFVQ